MAQFDPEIAITRLLKDNPDGKNIQMISKGLGISYLSAKKYIDLLIFKKKIKEQKLGRARVFYV